MMMMMMMMMMMITELMKEMEAEGWETVPAWEAVQQEGRKVPPDNYHDDNYHEDDDVAEEGGRIRFVIMNAFGRDGDHSESTCDFLTGEEKKYVDQLESTCGF